MTGKKGVHRLEKYRISNMVTRKKCEIWNPRLSIDDAWKRAGLEGVTDAE
jgi:hypothetical protein